MSGRKRAPRRIDPEIQYANDMRSLMQLAEFRRFLFTLALKSGIASVADSTGGATSFFDGRRSLGLEVLCDADATIDVRDPANAPFTALALCSAEAQQLLTQEAVPDEEDQPDYERH